MSTDKFAVLIDSMSRDDRFRATVAAINTLLVQKGIYTSEEFEVVFRDWAWAHGYREINAKWDAVRKP
jgi:hypothetical protein